MSKIVRLFALLLLQLPAARASASGESFASKLKQADFVFEGVVLDVSYKVWELSNGEPLPYTFVTYRVDKVLKGAANQPEVTLRFLGGMQDEERYMSPSGTPLFDEGDHDLLMVLGNGNLSCPLVDCAGGRFRIIGGLVVDDKGYHVEISESGEIRKGIKLELDDVNTHEVGGRIDHSGNSSLPKNLDDQEMEELLSRPGRLSPAGFSSYVEESIRSSHSQQELDAAGARFQSSDIEQDIDDPVMDRALTRPRAAQPSDFEEVESRLTAADIRRLDEADARIEAAANNRAAPGDRRDRLETKAIATHSYAASRNRDEPPDPARNVPSGPKRQPPQGESFMGRGMIALLAALALLGIGIGVTWILLRPRSRH